MTRNRTYRELDGERIEGTWRHIFIRNGPTYFLADLLIYADGLIDCWGPENLDTLREKIRSGWIATELVEGAEASAHHVGSWRFSEPRSWVNGDDLLREVADEIERLNDRPDSSRRCWDAIQRYVSAPTEENRRTVKEAYGAIPGHLRVYALGDQDKRDLPVRILITDIGDQLDDDGRVVTEAMHASALEYFANSARRVEEYRPNLMADGPERADAPTLVIQQVVYPQGWPDPPGLNTLRNEFPAPIVVAGTEYPTVTHAYWALSTSDRDAAATIRSAEGAFDADQLGRASPRRDGWPQARVGVMAALLRAKFDRHPIMAEVLTETADAPLMYSEGMSRFWGHGSGGRNWMGRLLETVRSELAAKRVPLS